MVSLPLFTFDSSLCMHLLSLSLCMYLLSLSLLPFVVLFLGDMQWVVLCFSFVVFGWSNYFLLACFNWVCKKIWPLESSIQLPARGSHSFEWIKPVQSTSIGAVWQLSVCMLNSCILSSKLQDYSYFNWQMSHAPPSLSPASQKAVTMDEVYLFKDGTDKFTQPPGKQPNRQYRI